MENTVNGHVTSVGKALDFTLATDANELLSLSSLRGKPVIVYFCPVV